MKKYVFNFWRKKITTSNGGDVGLIKKTKVFVMMIMMILKS